MNRKEILKHALKRGVVAFKIVVIPVCLLCSRSALMPVQAAGETPVQEECLTQEAQPENQAETGGTGEETAAQAEGVAEGTQEQTAAAAEEVPAENTAEEAQTAEAAEPLSVSMIGDSVMLGASPSILGMLPDCVIDAKVSRQVIQADAVLDALEQQNALRQTVVIALGTNGPFSIAKGQALIDRLGSGRTVYWVTAYGRELGWQEESNGTIRQLAENNENVHVIDWAQAVSGHQEWLCGDGIHLSAAGRDAYAQIVLGGLQQF